jgi:hypothetical protein
MRSMSFSASMALLMALFLEARLIGQSPNDPAVVAARERQRTIRTIEMEFSYTETFSRGSMQVVFNGYPRMKKEPVPVVETKVESKNRLLLDQKKVRLENNHPIWHLQRGELLDSRLISVFDSHVSKLLYPHGLGNDGIASGIIGDERKCVELFSYMFAPLALCLRGVDPDMTPYSYANFEPSGVFLPIDGSRCQQYVASAGRDRVTFWLDPTKGYVIRRLSIYKGTRLQEQYDVKYQESPSTGWLPISWTRSLFDDKGVLTILGSAQVLRTKLNESFAETEFNVVFPAGTQVYDQNTKKDYRVEADGTMREASRLGEELPASVSQPGDSWGRRHKWLSITCGAAIFLLLAALVFRRARHRAVGES